MEVFQLSLEIEKADNDQHAVYNQSLLDELLNNNDIDDFRKEFLAMHSYEQSEYFEDSDNVIRHKIFQLLSPQEVAGFSIN